MVGCVPMAWHWIILNFSVTVPDRTLQNDRQPRGMDPILPAVLEFLEETEETFFHAVITDVEPSAPQFKLAPTYTLYLAARYRASTHYRPELQPTERAHRLTVMLANVASMIQRVIQVTRWGDLELRDVLIWDELRTVAAMKTSLITLEIVGMHLCWLLGMLSLLSRSRRA